MNVLPHGKRYLGRRKASETLRFKTDVSVFKLGLSMLDLLQSLNLSNLDEIRNLLIEEDPRVFSHPEIETYLRKERESGDPNIYGFRILSQFQALGKKFPFEGSDDSCTAKAIESFDKSEAICKETNNRFDADDFESSDREFLNSVRDLIRSVLGDRVPSDILKTDIRFGPGSAYDPNSNRMMSETTLFYKLYDPLSVNRDNRIFLSALLSHNEGLVEMLRIKYGVESCHSLYHTEIRTFSHHLSLTDSKTNKITFVPKNSETHRTIGVEPSGLVPLQMVLGSFIRKRLKSYGINLDDQRRNRVLARLAHTAKLATIDLSMASDTLATSVVQRLLPPSWFLLFDSFRSTTGECRKKGFERDVVYEKFSSMGNGFTFELESLIFWAIAKISTSIDSPNISSRRFVSVFGDDIIVPQTSYALTCRMLNLCGFIPNEDKSFSSGLFFESCGVDYLNGFAVRPFYLKRKIVSIQDLNFVFNSLTLKSLELNVDYYGPMIRAILSEIPRRLRLFGPPNIDFDRNLWGRIIVDDLEACLRVPLEVIPLDYARLSIDKHGLITYANLKRSTVYATREENDDIYAKHICQYLIFLRGQIGGRIPLRGKTRTRLKLSATCMWDLIDTQARELLLKLCGKDRLRDGYTTKKKGLHKTRKSLNTPKYCHYRLTPAKSNLDLRLLDNSKYF